MENPLTNLIDRSMFNVIISLGIPTEITTDNN